MKMKIRCGPEEIREIEGKPVNIPGIDYKYFVVHNLMLKNGPTTGAWVVSEYQTGTRVVGNRYGLSEQMAIDHAKDKIKRGLQNETAEHFIESNLSSLGIINPIDPDDWGN